MLYLAYSIQIIILIIGFAWIKKESIFSPVAITASVWLVVFIGGIFFHNDYYPFTEKNLLLWLLWFLVSCFVYLVISHGNSNRPIGSMRCLPFGYSVFMLILIVGLICKILEIGNSGPAHFFLNLRLATIQVSDDAPSLGLIGHLYPLIFALFIFESLNTTVNNRCLRLLLWTWMLLFAVATMGKFAILTPFLAWLIIKHRRREIKVKKIALICMTIFALMLVVHIARAGEGGYGGILKILSVYIYSPIIAFDQLQVSGSGTTFGECSFRFFYAVKYYLFGGVPPVHTILDYVVVPIPTNVYTCMQPFYHDFGTIGVLFGALFYGFFFGGLYRFFLRGDQLAIIAYAGFSISLVSQFLGETFVSNFSGNLQFFIAAALVVFFSKKRNICL